MKRKFFQALLISACFLQGFHCDNCSADEWRSQLSLSDKMELDRLSQSITQLTPSELEKFEKSFDTLTPSEVEDLKKLMKDNCKKYKVPKTKGPNYSKKCANEMLLRMKR
jgi:hypothetical protein